MIGKKRMQNNSINLVEIFEDEPRISHRVIAELTGNLPKSILDLITKNKSDFEEFGNLRFKIVGLERTTKAGISRGIVESKIYFLNEQQATLLMTYLQNTKIVKRFKVRLVQDFYTMKEILQNQQPQIQETETDRNLKALKSAIEILRVNDASKILMLETLYKDLGLNTNYLPKYSDENHSVSLSSLLKKFDVGMSANKFNKLLIEKGFLEIQKRKSSKTETNEKGEKIPIYKEFKSITKKGEEFGKNKVSTQNQLQTQPHYFENRFEELLEIIQIQKTLF